MFPLARDTKILNKCNKKTIYLHWFKVEISEGFIVK